MDKNKYKINWRKTDDLIPYARNARVHSDEQVAQIAASITEFGWTNPILLDGDNGVIAGHGRLMAARKLEHKEVPTIDLHGLSEAQKRAYIIADNKTALNASWDFDMLTVEFEELAGMDFDLALTGFDDGEVQDITAIGNAEREGHTEEDDVPEAPVKPVTVLGDIWTLGRHRLMCGDSTSADNVGALLDGAVPHLMVTDPPYGVEYDASWRTEVGLQKTGAHGKVANDDRADWSEAWALFPGEVAYVWHAASALSAVVCKSLQDCGFEVRMQIIWNKNHSPIGRGHYHFKHEPCWYAVKKGGTGHWQGSRKEHTVWDIEKPQKSETGHSTQKPVECMRKPIENNSAPKDSVYEPFSGSGTTIIAAEQTGRTCYAMEISPAYVDVAIRRWQDFTQQVAVRDDGVTYNELTDAEAVA